MSFKTITCALALTAAAGVAFAGGHGGNPAVKARQAHMQLYAFNLGILGGMAKGEREYSAEDATIAANALSAVAGFDQSLYYPEGSSRADLGEETKALPAIWEDWDGYNELKANLATAAENMAAVAGDGQAALGPALGEVGKACGACHKEFQHSDG